MLNIDGSDWNRSNMLRFGVWLPNGRCDWSIPSEELGIQDGEVGIPGTEISLMSCMPPPAISGVARDSRGLPVGGVEDAIDGGCDTDSVGVEPKLRLPAIGRRVSLSDGEEL